ncbi:MAG TPA: M3 family metallopeptidase [Xanthomonadaceae bacterium]|nr:M3 family metallopeptidase [Xanthomonadaceae bacterium]
MSANPLLEDFDLPPFTRIEPAHVVPAVDALLAEYRARVDALVADPGAADFEQVMAPLERLEERLGRAWAPVGHLHGVLDSPALREVYGEALDKLTDHATELGQNRALHAAVRRVAEADGFAVLDRPRRALVEDALRDFHLAGVDLPDPQRARFKAVQNELSRLQTGFEQAVLDATDAWTRPVDAHELAGLPDSARAMLREAARARDADGHLATLKGPVVQAVLTYAEDRELRAQVYRAYNTRASDQGPHAGQFDNAGRIAQILALRHESAQLLGYASAAHLSLVDKMAGTPERVLGFLRELAARSRPVADRELAELARFAGEELGIADLAPWDLAYAAEKLRARRFDFGEEDLKPYFEADAVLAGLFAIAQRVFGVRLARRGGVETWHPDVRYYDLYDADADADGALRAGVYVDLYARERKRGGAWMDVCRARIGGDHPPVAFLTCNFAPPAADTPALLTHEDVLTLFHEFGHGLHHMLTEVDWPSVGGIAGVEWDAVELPSQFMENFAWQREGLALFARHWRTGEPLPEALYAKMRAARDFHAGLFLVRQLEFALYDFRIHLEYDPARGPRTLELLQAVREEVAVVKPPPWHRFPMSFTHIFAGGYAAGYYSYLWAEVLSADAFDAFEQAGIFDAPTGARFHREILAVGGSRPALESFVAFRGREPDPDALLRSYGLA